MHEVDAFARDRRRYKLHAATALIGMIGWLGTAALSNMIVPAARAWVLVGFAVLLVVSGALAISVGRTLISKSAHETHGLDLEGDPGDAMSTPGLASLNLLPGATNAMAPYGLLIIGLVFLALSLMWALG
jgi:hypothetical protein